MAGIYNFTTDQGATLQQTIIWRAPQTDEQLEEDESGTPIDLTGYTARMQLRTSVADEVADLELTTENERIILGDPDAATPAMDTGKIRLVVDADTMTELPAGSYKYDLELEDSDGVVTRLLRGKIKVIAEITRED